MKLVSNLPAALLAAFFLPQVVAGLPFERETERVSLTSAGLEATFRSNYPVISADGSFVAFESSADDLVPGDTNFSKDVFVHDRVAGTTTRVSVSSSGAQGDHHSVDPSISADGRYVAFSSRASNLVSGDTNFTEDAFLHDRNTGTTTRVVLGLGAQPNGYVYQCDISPDGTFLAFTSAASNLVLNDTNNSADVFVRDLATGVITRVSVSSTGAESDGNSFEAALSTDGQIVAFYSIATDLVDDDTNGQPDVFVHELGSGQTTRVSLSTAGDQGNSYSQFPNISGAGRYVVFESRATTLVPNDLNGYDDVFLHDRVTGETSIVSVDSNGVYGDWWSNKPSISADGQRIAYSSWSTNLIASDSNSRIDIFVYDTSNQTTRRVSLDSAGVPSGGHSFDTDISADGRFVAFHSEGDNLVPGDTNGYGDIFVTDSLGAAVVTARNAGANPMSYTASAPVLGASWTGDVDLTTTGHSFAVVYWAVASANLPLGGGVVLLIAGQKVLKLSPQPGPLASWSVPLPNDTSLAGLSLFSQAVHVFGAPSIALSNAQDLCLGY